MNRAWKAAGVRVAAGVAVAMAAALCGCAMVVEDHVLERQFTENQLRTIRNGQTTKKEVLDRLGPPAAVARPDTGTTDNVLRRFAATVGNVRSPLVYRYDTSALAWANLCVFGQFGGDCIPSTPVLKERTLWILIDEKEGRVADHLLEETAREKKDAGIRPWPEP